MWVPESGCLIWMLTVGTHGYGQLATRGGRCERKTVRAHRHSYELANGPIPKGLCVLHKCDTPLCINPSHLYLGDHVQNGADMSKRHRKHGERAGRSAKLTDAKVIEMRKLYANGRSVESLMAEFGVRMVATYNALSGRTWSHIPVDWKKYGRSWKQS